MTPTPDEKRERLRQLLEARSGVVKYAPLSFAQERMWFIEHLNPGSPTYHMPLVVRLRGPLDHTALGSDLSEVVTRHEALRTSIVTIDGQAVQAISPVGRAPLALVDLGGLPRGEREPSAFQRIAEEVRRPFDLSQAPLFRATLIELSDRERLLLLIMHHIVSDAWSMGVLLGELSALYRARCEGRPAALAALPLHYADYAAWQRKQLEGEALEREIGWWRERLDPSAVLTLPGDRGRPALQSSRGARLDHPLSPQLTGALKALAQREGTTLFVTLLAAFEVLLQRYTGQTDISVGTPVANRDHADTQGLIGPFINTLVLRSDLSGAPTFRALLQQLHRTSRDALGHQSLPFERLVDALRPERSLARAPLFQIMFVLQSAPQPPVAAAGLVIEVENVDVGGSAFDLTLIAEDRPAGLRLTAVYSTDLFSAELIARVLRHYDVLLEGLVAEPGRRVSELPLLAAEERHQLVVEWNETAVEYAQDRCVHESFEAQAEALPEAVALVFEGQRLTYRELNERANRLGHHLRSLGVGPEVLVGLCVERSVEMVVGILGILKAGGAYVPLDPAHPRERLAFMAADAACPVLLTKERHLANLPDHRATVVRLDADAPAIAACSDADLGRNAGATSIAYVLYTSGSTGKPKGVVIEHRGLTNYVTWAAKAYRVAEGWGAPVHSSIGFDLTLTGLFTPLVTGRAVELLPEEDGIEALVAALADRGGASLVKLTPPHLDLLNHLMPAEEAAGATRAFVIGGDALSSETLAFWRKHAPATRLINEYGPTETVVGCCVYDVPAGDDPRQGVPIGRPIANTRLYVLDPSMQPVPVGVPGELYIGGAGVARGYLNRPELTAERFLRDPFCDEPGARLYRTGDLCRWRPDSNLEYLGRIDHQVKIRGFRVELGEIESVLGQHPSIREAVALAREDVPGDKRLVAYLVAREAPLPRVSELRGYLQSKLPEHMVPAAFVELPALPLTRNGKVDRRALPAPDLARPEQGSAFVAPRTPVEEVLAGIWAKVLRVDDVGVLDNFFTVGGDSILAIQVISKARQAGLGLSVRQIFQHQTIASLAEVATATTGPDAKQGPVAGPVALTPIQRWFFEQERADPHHFNQAMLLDLRERPNLMSLTRAVRHLVQHHDALRLRFTREGAAIHQVNARADETVTVVAIDLSAVPVASQARAIEAAAADVQASLCLESGPLMRVAWLDLGVGRSGRLLVVIHHLAVDGVSWRILLEDLETAYGQAGRGEALRLPRKSTSFQQWAERLTAQAQSDTVYRELSYWRSLSPATALPVDSEGGANMVASARTVEVALEVEETRALLQEVPEVYRTRINDVLLTALGQALAPWVGTRRLRLDLEGHGREEIAPELDLSRTVGWFTALFPVVLELPEAPLGEVLKAVKEQLRGIPNQGLGYGMLRYLRQDATTGAELAAAKPAEVSFNYLGQLDASAEASSLLGFAAEPSGPAYSPRAARTHRLDINGWVSGERLRVGWTYSEDLHRRETIERVAQGFSTALRALVAHCQSPEAGGRTPADFPLAKLTQTAVDRLVGRGRDVEDVYPLSPMQQGMLFHALRDEGSGVYVEQMTFRVAAGLRVPAFAASWRQVMDRHAVLRSAFVWEGLDEPLQIVRTKVALPWVEHDLRGAPAIEREARVSEVLAEDRARGLELSAAPLMRLTLLRLGEEAYQVVWTSHHLLLDGWSMSLLFQELFVFYEAACQGATAHLPPARPYRDYVAWLRQQEQGGAEAFWRTALRGFHTPTPLPVDRSGDVGAASPVAPLEQDRRLSASTTEALEQFSRAHGLTPSTVLQGAWGLLLSRYSGEEDVVFGATQSGRSVGLPEMDTMVGLFINTLPVRVRSAPEAPVVPWLKQLQEQQALQLPHAYSPLFEVQRLSEVPRGRALFESLLVVENYPMDKELSRGNVPLAITDVRAVEQTNYPLTVVVRPGRETLLRISYATESFDAPTIARMLGHFQTLLEDLVAEPRRRVADLPLLTEAERHQMLVAWNDTEANYPRGCCLHDLFEAQAEETPESVALVFEGEPLTYRELNRRANRLAYHLRALGVGPDVLVALCVERSFEMMIGLFGILKAGGAYVPLDPEYPRERLAFMLEDSGARVLLTLERLRELLPPSRAHVVYLDTGWETMGSERREARPPAVAPEHLAYVIYTSGSTGRPKGAMSSHRAIVNRLLWMQDAYRLTAADRVLQKTPISFDVSVWELFWPLLCGATLVLAHPGGHRDGQYLVDAIVEHRVTTAHFVPSMLYAFLEQPDVERCTSLRRVVCSGEELPAELQARFYRRLGAELHNLYGPTEAAVDVTSWACPRDAGDGPVPIGRPIANTQIHLLDPRLQPVPVGVPGELYIGGVAVGRGYLGRPALTAERFIPDPFSSTPGARLYRTGDRARRRADGAIEFRGRADLQQKIRGFRIEIGEVEAALRAHPAVQDAAVVARDYGPGDKRLVAYVVPHREHAFAVRRIVELERAGLLGAQPVHELPNGMAVFHKNVAETQFLYHEIFVEGYLKHGVTLRDGDCIFDVGANIGLFSLFAASRARDTTVFAFEPIPEIFRLLKLNADLCRGDVRAFSFGLSDREKEASFTYYPHASLVSGYYGDADAEREVVRAYELNQERGRGAAAEPVSNAVLDELLAVRMTGERVVCPLRPLSAVLREHRVQRIDLLKIDVEKSESDVLDGIADEDWDKIRQIVVEVHDIDGRLARMTRGLRERGFELVVEQQPSLAGTNLHAIYAMRGVPMRDVRPGVATAAMEPASQPSTPARFTAELRRSLGEKLPEHMVPSAFQVLDALPLTPSGKVDRRALPAPDVTRPGLAETFAAPRTPLEEALAGIWAELLHLDRIGVHDDFFALGGHSLLGAQVVSRLRARIGLELPLRALFEAPTVAGLAARVQEASRSQRGPGDPHVAPRPSALVRLQAGEAHRRPLFFVHGAGGGVVDYTELVQGLDRARPFYGIDAPAADDGSAAPPSLEAMARGYLAELRAVQPQGPYLLGGWSFGGVVAFEMAQQLLVLGEPVAMLALLDSRAPAGRPEPEPDPLASLAAFGTALGLSWRQLLLDPDHLRRLGPRDRLAYVLEQARRSPMGALDLDLDQAERWLRRFEHHLEALRRYTPRLYHGSAVVFRAATPSGSAPPPADLGWSAWITGGIATRDVPGDHRTMLRAPHASVLAEHLDHYLS